MIMSYHQAKKSYTWLSLGLKVWQNAKLAPSQNHFTLNNPNIDSSINFNVDSWIYWSLPKWTPGHLWRVLPHLETLWAGGLVHHKVLNMEKTQLTFRSSLTITLTEAVNLEVDVKKCVSGFTVKTLTLPYFIPVLMLHLLAVEMGCWYWPYSGL